jgi:hypothetical protein
VSKLELDLVAADARGQVAGHGQEVLARRGRDVARVVDGAPHRALTILRLAATAAPVAEADAGRPIALP